MAQRKRNKRASAPRRSRRKSSFTLPAFLQRKRADFKPDSNGGRWSGLLHMTNAQRDTWLKWGSYVAICVLLCMIQDVIMSKVHIFGATTDLVVSAILLLTVMEGVEVGSLFVLISSLLYYFSGSSPGPYSIILLTVFGIGASMLRQVYLHRGLIAITFCAGSALMLYEIATCLLGIFQGLTYWSRIFSFVFTGMMSWAFMLALYPLFHRIGLIGGNIWKE